VEESGEVPHNPTTVVSYQLNLWRACVSFKRQEGPVLGPGDAQIEEEKRSGSDNDQCTYLKDQVATNVSQAQLPSSPRNVTSHPKR
jgi:hypothetical protein